MHRVQLLGMQSMVKSQSRWMQARILGMLSPWLPPASVSVRLHGATFEHRSFAILTSKSQPWLTNALVDMQLMVMLLLLLLLLLLHCHIVNIVISHSSHDPASSCMAPDPQLLASEIHFSDTRCASLCSRTW
jgi:hypothetical protein